MNNFSNRIKQVIDYKQISTRQFEQKIGTSNGVIAKILAKNTDLSGMWLSKIVEIFPDINSEWLLTGEGNMLKAENLSVINKSNQKPVYLYDVSAAAGYGSFDEMITAERIIGEYIIPDFKDVDWLIYVKGSSMYPKYSSGDIIALRRLYESRFIQWGKVYVVATKEQGVLVKRLRKSEKEDCILAVSDNPSYEPFDIPKDEIIGIALVVGVLRLE